MNNDPSSDPKQCTVSKLGRVHSAHTQDPDCACIEPRPRARRALGAVSQRAGRRVTARTCALLRRVAARWAMSQRRVGRSRCPPVLTQKLCRDQDKKIGFFD